MNKNSYLFTCLVIASLLTPTTASAYYMSMDIGSAGVVSYSYPSVLGDEDEQVDKKEESKQEQKKEESKQEQKKEVKREELKKADKPTRVEQRPEKIEIKKIENKTKVKLIKQNKVKQELEPEKVNIKFSAVPKITPSQTPEIKKEDKTKIENETKNETENEIENETKNETATQMVKTIKERSERKDEKIEIQSETNDTGNVEMKLQSRDVKAKIKNSEIEIDVKNNNIGTTNDEGKDIRLIHLPDQALQKFIERGLSTVPDTMEVGKSSGSFEYSINATKKERLFGIIPRDTSYKLTMDDQNGVVTEKKVSKGVIDRVLNIFSF